MTIPLLPQAVFSSYSLATTFIFWSSLFFSVSFYLLSLFYHLSRVCKNTLQNRLSSLSRWLGTGISCGGFLVLLVLGKRMGWMVGMDGWMGIFSFRTRCHDYHERTLAFLFPSCFRACFKILSNTLQTPFTYVGLSFYAL
jgi:hypothetical protein